MKKAIALLIAVAAVFSIGITTFAAEEDVQIVSDSAISTYLQYAPGSTTANPLVTAAAGDLILVLGTSPNLTVVLPDTYLKPGQDYRFNVYKVDTATGAGGASPESIAMSPLTLADLAGGKLRVRTGKGSTSIASAKISTRGSGNATTYQLVVTTRENYTTKLSEVIYNFDVTGGTGSGLNLGSASFQVGWRAMTDEEIESYGEGDTVTIMEDRPVIKKAQFTTLAKNYNYRPVIFEAENGGWIFEGRVSGMGDSNFTSTYDAIPSIVNAMDTDQDYKFLTFNAGVTFPTNGEMRIDASDISGTFDTIYTYLYRDGALTPIATTYDATSDEIVFRTNYLGSFLMTDRAITNENLVGPGTTEPEPNPLPTLPENPNTGAATGAIALIGLASLAGAMGSRKRKQK